MSKILEGLKYSKDHEWVKIEGSEATIGITDYAQEKLGEIVYVELPPVGETFAADEHIADIESVKAASEIATPVGGKVSEDNTILEDKPELLNQDPYANYIYKMQDVKDPGTLLDKKGYEEYLRGL